MYTLLLCVAVLLITHVECGKPTLSDPLGLYEEVPFKFGTGTDYVSGSVWPKPQQEARENTLYALNPDKFTCKLTGKSSDVLTEALTRYAKLIFPDKDISPDRRYDLMSSLDVNVVEDYAPMNLATDESYTLVVSAPTSSLSANTVWGALRGLETFSQIVYQNETGAYYAQQNKIVDFPRFQHRGYLIDTGRHYVAVDIIMQFIDALAYSKYNILHWHIVDDQSFPFVSKKFPSLHNTGAWNNKTHIYTPDDVKKIIDYANLRGVRVISEFDTPGHAQSWYSIPNLLTPCYSGGKPNGKYGPINPTVESNYAFLEEFFTEVVTVFPDQYIHMGGDEVSFDCWESNPNIAKWMEEKGMGKNYSKLEQYYEQRLLDIVGSLKKKYIVWQEVIDNLVKVGLDTVVNVWKGNGDVWKSEVEKVTKLGYPVILSAGWYLSAISYGPDWITYYKNDPQSINGTDTQKNLVIGGEACMWGEWVDGTNLIARSWGRGLAIGERLWSSKTTTDITDATRRIWEHRCRYLRRGIQAENVVQSQYCRHEWKNYHNNI